MDINQLLIKYHFPNSESLSVRHKFWARIPTKSRKYYISIVAGDWLYSEPREALDIPKYTEFEIAIFHADGVLEKLNWATGEVEEILKSIFGEIEDSVIGYATQEQIWACVDAL